MKTAMAQTVLVAQSSLPMNAVDFGHATFLVLGG